MLKSDQAVEIFLTATPGPSGAPLEAAPLFSGIRKVLDAQGARVLQERLFATTSALPDALAARKRAYGALDDGAPPVLLDVPAGLTGAIAGVQVHAVRTADAPQVVRLGGEPCGRMVTTGGVGYIALSGLIAPEAGSKANQGRAIFKKAEGALRASGASMLTVARTWLWLGDILSWYDEFNGVRNKFFSECGLLNGDPVRTHMPASTGIGVRPAGSAACALDAIAVVGAKGSIEYFRDAGNQRSPYHYGSAFSRTARATSPAGTTVFVSGTAAIDAAGNTACVGDARGQIEMTIANVRAALKDMGCGDREVVQAFAYSKTPEVQGVFHEGWADLGWPCISVVGDVCRHDLLFEVEATACPGARKA